jgi:hypothetical protein
MRLRLATFLLLPALHQPLPLILSRFPCDAVTVYLRGGSHTRDQPVSQPEIRHLFSRIRLVNLMPNPFAEGVART